MKTRALLYLIPLLVLGCFASKKINYDEPRKVAKQKLVPPGTVWLRDSTFIDETEIRNLDYLECLYLLHKTDREQFLFMLPDTLCWKKVIRDSTAINWVLYYLRHPGYRNFPVVGISYEQAIYFCEWRSLMVNRYYYIRMHGGWENFTPDSINRIQPTKWVEYRLPTKEEWEYAAAAGLNYKSFPLGYQNLLDKRNLPVSNTAEFRNVIRYSQAIHYKQGKRHIYLEKNQTQEVYAGQPNCYGIYNTLGNVSELIAGSSFKGLSYHSTIDGNAFAANREAYQKIDSTGNMYDYKYTFRYTETQPWLGFRCICVVKKQPDQK